MPPISSNITNIARITLTISSSKLKRVKKLIRVSKQGRSINASNTRLTSLQHRMFSSSSIYCHRFFFYLLFINAVSSERRDDRFNALKVGGIFLRYFQCFRYFVDREGAKKCPTCDALGALKGFLELDGHDRP